jgi:hypothetical protein
VDKTRAFDIIDTMRPMAKERKVSVADIARAQQYLQRMVKRQNQGRKPGAPSGFDPKK